MRMTPIFIVCLVAVLFLIGKESPSLRQEQVATASDERIAANGPQVYDVVYKVKSMADEPLADIIWMKKAAAIALEKGVPNFNVLKQKIHRVWQPKSGHEMSVVEGTIELMSDPMSAEYDAEEIESLVLTEDTEKELYPPE